MSISEHPNNKNFSDQYNKDIEEGEADIDAGNYATQDEVEQLFADRRKTIDNKQNQCTSQ